jgi:site-specific recombinase XerD
MASRKADGDSWISEAPDKDGYYNAFVSMGPGADGKPDRRHLRRKKLPAVRAAVKKLEQDRDAGKVTRKGRKPTVREMLEQHLDVTLRARGRAPRTIYSYRSTARNHIYPRWGKLRIDQLRDDQIEAAAADMLVKGYEPSGVRKMLAILSSAYELRVERGEVGRNPCDSVHPPDLGPSKATELTEAEAVEVMRTAIGRDNSARWSVGLACGLRQGEALGLRWSFLDIDVEDGETGVMRVWWQLQRGVYEHGCIAAARAELDAIASPKDRAARAAEILAACTAKWHKRPCPKRCPKIRASGRRHVCVPADAKRLCEPACTAHAAQCPERTGGGMLFREIKEKRRKTLPIPPELVTELREHRDAQLLQALTVGDEWEDNDLVFCQWNGAPIDSKADWREWSAILTVAGLRHHRVHAMRHSAATILLNKGVALAVVQELLGHSDIRVTRSYTHVSSALAKDAAGRMGGLLKQSREPAEKTARNTQKS